MAELTEIKTSGFSFPEDMALPAFVAPLRRHAMKTFQRLGFPHKKLEDWKYSDLAPWLKKNWNVRPAENVLINTESILRHFIPNISANILVFINGRYAAENSVVIEKDPQILITSFNDAIAQYPEVVSAHFGRYASFEKSGLTALNTALAADGLFVFVPEGKKLSAPVHALYFHSGDELFIQCRNLIVLEEFAQADIIESTLSLDSSAAFSNTVTEMSIAPSALLNYYKIQKENSQSADINLTHIEQEKGSLCHSYVFNLSGGFIRNDLHYNLSARQCEAHLYGLYLPSDNEHFDNHTFVDHAMPECYSNELYKGIIKDRSTAVFNGKIVVRPDAQKTNAYQSNKNILLSAEGHVDTKPQLEIFADDVKCSHGATIGQLNEEAIFYLRSRGIDEKTAGGMVMNAFAGEAIEPIENEAIREYLRKEIENKLLYS